LTGRFRSSLGLHIAKEFDRAPDVARSLLERACGGTIRQFEVRFRDWTTIVEGRGLADEWADVMGRWVTCYDVGD
jgi:hypothetical protein